MESGGVQTLANAFSRPQRPLMILCAALLLALIGWELWTALHAAFYHPAAAPQTSARPAQTADQVNQITAADLFGHAAAGANGAQQLPQTSAQLVLRGVFTASDPQQASAIIETSDGHAQVFRAGASVAPDTVLREVYGDRVVLARNGAMENLYFPALAENEGGAAPEQGPAGAPAEAPPPNTASPAPEGELTADQKRANILRRLEELRARGSQ